MKTVSILKTGLFSENLKLKLERIEGFHVIAVFGAKDLSCDSVCYKQIIYFPLMEQRTVYWQSEKKTRQTVDHFDAECFFLVAANLRNKPRLRTSTATLFGSWKSNL